MNAQEADPFYIKPSKLPTAPHHQSFQQLWETKWKKPAQLGVYPFMFGYVGDFEPIVDSLIKAQMKEPYDWDKYAEAFLPTAQKLVERAQEAKKAGKTDEACEYFLRASAVYRIARFPIPRSEKQKLAWEKGKDAVFRGLELKDHPVLDIRIPHTNAAPGEGSEIPVALCIPPSASIEKPAPVLILITGLDGYRTELSVWAEGFSKLGVATLIHEIPGTGDCPALKADPKSPDRLYDSILEWIDLHPKLDGKNICVWAFSTGGFYAIRAAHTHASRFNGVVAQGGGCHHMLDPRWLKNADRLEYPFDVSSGLCQKFGYKTEEEFNQDAMKRFSLLEDGTLDQPFCAPLLLVNGLGDEIFPIDDYFLLLQHGAPKEARFVEKQKHMGEPDGFPVILTWLYSHLGVGGANDDSRDRKKRQEELFRVAQQQLKGLPFKAQFTGAGK